MARGTRMGRQREWYEKRGERRSRRTFGLVAGADADDALVLEIDEPALLVALGVGEGDGEGGFGLVDGFSAGAVVGAEGGVDVVEDGRGRELV